MSVQTNFRKLSGEANSKKTTFRTVGVWQRSLRDLEGFVFFVILYYGIAVWALTHKSLLDPVIVSQKKILRIMNFKEPNSHTEPHFAQLQFLKIRDMHELQILSFMYDCQNHLAPTHFHSYFMLSSEMHGYNTRLASRGDLFLSRKTTFQYGIRAIQYSGARLFL